MGPSSDDPIQGNLTGNPYQAPQADVLLPTETAGDLEDWATPGLGKRWLAYFIDQILMIVVAVVIMVLVGAVAGEAAIDAIPDQVFGLVIAGIATFAYGAMEGSAWHATPGKKLLGMVVIKDDGTFMDSGEALKRNAAKWIGLSICGLLAFSVYFDPQRRGTWDKVSASRTVVRNPYAS
jgi:uncharacterized RDD family membrane protein YckC